MKGIVERMKREARDWEKILAKRISVKGLVSKMHTHTHTKKKKKKLSKINNKKIDKKKNNNSKVGKKSEQTTNLNRTHQRGSTDGK